jgi:hypothetical protein
VIIIIVRSWLSIGALLHDGAMSSFRSGMRA